MLGFIVIGGLMVAGYFYLRGRLIGRFTDRVTSRNRSQLIRYLFILGGAFLLLLILMALTNHP